MRHILKLLFQLFRRIHVVQWRILRSLYWNAHPKTHVPWKSRIAVGCRILLETGGFVRIGNNCQLCSYTILAPYGGSIVLGDHVFIAEHCVVYGHGGLTIGDDTMIGPHSAIVPMNHVTDNVEIPMSQQSFTAVGVHIGKDCWLGAGVKVLDGVRIGDGCVIGAGAVVRTSLEPYSIAVGVPARVIGKRENK